MDQSLFLFHSPTIITTVDFYSNYEDKRGFPLSPDTHIIGRMFVKLLPMVHVPWQPFHHYTVRGERSQCHLRKEKDMLLRKYLPDRKRKWEAFFQIPVDYGKERSNANDFTYNL